MFWVTRLRPRVWSQMWYVPVWTYLRRPRGTRNNTSLIRWRTNDGLKTIILSSSSGDVAFLTPRTTRGRLLVICQVQNTWSGNLTRVGERLREKNGRDTWSPDCQEKKTSRREVEKGVSSLRQKKMSCLVENPCGAVPGEGTPQKTRCGWDETGTGTGGLTCGRLKVNK